MKRKIRISALFFCILFFTAIICTCYIQFIYNQPTSYISITTTSKEKENYFYIYDMRTKNLSEVYHTKDTAQYPLGTVDRKQNYVYYTQRIYRENQYGDQLMCYNLKTKKITQLTDDLYAVNRIIPNKNKVYLIASTYSNHNLALLEYDWNINSYNILTPDTDMVVQMTYNKNNQEILYASYDWQTQKKMRTEYEQERAKQPVAKNAPYTIYKYDIKKRVINKVLNTNNLISSIDLSKDGKKIIMRTAESLFANRYTIIYDLEEKKENKKIPMEQIGRIEGISFSPNETGIYFTGILSPEYTQDENDLTHPTPPNALIYMDMSTGKYEDILSFPDKFINNFLVE